MPSSGRGRETAEIITYLRAGQVARILLGETQDGMSYVDDTRMASWNRNQVQAELFRVRNEVKGEVHKFLRRNFPRLTPQKLSSLYETLDRYKSISMSMAEFEEFTGGSATHVFDGVPRHATIRYQALV